MFIGKKYDKIEFAMAENLSDELKEKAGKGRNYTKKNKYWTEGSF